MNNKSSLSRTISGTVLNDDEIFNSIYGADSDLFIGANTTKQRIVPEISASQKTARNSKLKESTMKLSSDEFKSAINENTMYVSESDEYSSNVFINLPKWGYANFINERDVMRKGISSPLDNPAWFYFKVFFDFNTQHGLFGGLLNNFTSAESKKYMFDNTMNSSMQDYMDSVSSNGLIGSANRLRSTNSMEFALNTSAFQSAAHYLKMNSDNPSVKWLDRAYALLKFTSLLSYICTNAPWYFKGVKNLQSVGVPYTENYTREKYIELELNVDAIDMRISSLIDLYKFAAYDSVNCREILPENMRKFDMTLVIFESPLRYLHTAYKFATDGISADSTSQTKNYKTVNPNGNDYENVMSFKLYQFVNCEIDISSLGNSIPGEISNEEPFQIKDTLLKIKYERVYEHTMNEFFGLMWGDSGVKYNRNARVDYLAQDGETRTAQTERYRAMQKMFETSTKISEDQYKVLIDASEAICHKNLMNMGGNTIGNIYGEDTLVRNSYSLYLNSTNETVYDNLKRRYFPNSNTVNAILTRQQLNGYFNEKIRYIHQREQVLGETGASIISEWLGTGYSRRLGNIYDHEYGTMAATIPGQGHYDMGISGPMNNRVNSDYLNDKLATLHGNPNKYTNTEYDKIKNTKQIQNYILTNSGSQINYIRVSTNPYNDNIFEPNEMTSTQSEYFKNKLKKLHKQKGTT